MVCLAEWPSMALLDEPALLGALAIEQGSMDAPNLADRPAFVPGRMVFRLRATRFRSRFCFAVETVVNRSAYIPRAARVNKPAAAAIAFILISLLRYFIPKGKRNRLGTGDQPELNKSLV